MPTLAFPTLANGPSVLSWSLVANTLVHASPLSQAVRTLAMPGARWKFSATWRALSGTERRTVEGWLASLNGRAGRFTFTPPEYLLPRGSARTASINGPLQTGSTLALTTTASATFEAGDFIELPTGQLVRATAFAQANGAGLASVPIAPMLRTSPTNGAACVLAAPKGSFQLLSDEAGLVIGTGGYADWTLDAVEALA
jgi:hypothetical protein